MGVAGGGPSVHACAMFLGAEIGPNPAGSAPGGRAVNLNADSTPGTVNADSTRKLDTVLESLLGIDGPPRVHGEVQLHGQPGLAGAHPLHGEHEEGARPACHRL